MDFAIEGWAFDRSRATERLRIDLVDESGKIQAQGLADVFRSDLQRAGIADGKCGFWIPLPPSLTDGTPHRIRALVADTGDELPGEVEIRQSSSVRGDIDGIDGRFVTGWAFDHEAPDAPLRVELVEAGVLISSVVADRTEDRGPNRFRLPLPDEYLDGRPHAFTVRLPSGRRIAGAAVITPSITKTPAVFERATPGSDAVLTDARARYRYESLTRQMAELLEDPRPPVWEERLAMLQTAHREVVKGFEHRSPRDELVALAFPPVPAPRVSVVVPVHDHLAVTYHCLASLLLAPNRASFEVIVVDDGSEDGTRRLKDVVRGIEIVRTERVNGFGRSSNLGATKARGEYLVMLNNDTEVTAGWLDAMLDVFEQFDGIGIVGAKLLYPDGRLQEAGGIVWGGGEAWNYGRNGNALEPRFNYVRQTDYLSGACLMVPKEVWSSLGGFDEHYAPAYYEDADLAFRARERGLKTVYTPFCEIFHFEGQSNGTSVESGIKRFQAVNEAKFRARWAHAYRAGARVGRESPDLAKDRRVALRALVIDAETPQPDRDAGSYAILQEMRILQSLGFKVTFVAENARHLGTYTQALQRMGVECLFSPFVGTVREVMERRGSEFDLVYVARYYVAAAAIDAIRQYAPQARVVLNNIDLHFLRELRTALARKDPQALARSLKTREDELSTMRKVDMVLSYNPVEHAVIVSHNLDTGRVASCPWVVAVPERIADYGTRADIAFLGGFQHEPNIDAVEYFVRSVMPLLRRDLPGVRLRIYGSQAREKLDAFASEDVVLDGYVPSVEQVYETCRVFVAPLLSGAGLKGKVVGALAHGVPCVLSPVAAEGIRVLDGVEAFVADSPTAWANAIALLYKDEARWNEMSRAARTLAEREYSFERGVQVMQDALGAAGLHVARGHASVPALVARSVRN